MRELIGSRYGTDYLPEEPNVYKTKKSAQDAHEAIRPTSLEYPPEKVKEFLEPDMFRLYTAHLEPLRRLPDEARGLRPDHGGHRRRPR